MRVPIDQTLAAIDQPLGVHIHKNLDHRVWEIARHGESLAVPITRGPKPLQLVDNGAARLRLPLPNLVQKSLAAHLAARRRFGLGQFTLDHHLRRNAGVIGANLPQHIMPAHPVPADQNILQRVVKGMPHMQGSGDIWWWDHDRKRLGSRPRIRPRAPHLLINPLRRNPGFGFGSVKGLFHRHRGLPCNCWLAIPNCRQKAKRDFPFILAKISPPEAQLSARAARAGSNRPVQPRRQMDQAFARFHPRQPADLIQHPVQHLGVCRCNLQQQIKPPRGGKHPLDLGHRLQPA